jgi:tetratricopeptide (TPR) repeat protein
MTGEAIAPIYTIKVPGFDTDPEDIPDNWKRNLKRRQYLDARPWWTEGAEAFAQAEIRERLEELDRRCYEKVRVARHLEGTRSTIPPHNPMFVGRSEQIRQIQAAFTEPGPSLVALHGLGGMGKSVLAHEYAHVHAQRYRAGRFLLPAEGKSDLKTLITSLATDLELAFTDAERADPDLAHRRVCTALAQAARDEGGPALVLLENVDDPGLLTRSAVSEALPPRDAAHVIATTRLGEDTLKAATCLEVGALPTTDATRLLNKHRPFSGEADPAAARAAAKGIAERLGGYPLAMEVTAVYLRETPEVSYAGFLERLEREGIGAVEGASQDGLVQLARHPETLVSKLLAPTLAGLSEAEALAVAYAAALPPDAVAVPWLRTLVTAEQPGIIPETKPGYPDPWQTLVTRRLRGLRLLADGEHPKVMRMHRVVQEVVRRRMGTGRAEALREQALALAQHRAEGLEEVWVDRKARWEEEPLLRVTAIALDNDHPRALHLANTVRTPLLRLRETREARRLMRKAIAIGEKAFSADHPTLATTYSNLAEIEQDLGRFEQACDLAQKAIAVFEETLDSDHPHLATSYTNLAMVEQALGQLEEARRLMHKALAIDEKAFAADHPTLARDYSNLALIEQDLGRLEEARDLMQRAVAIREDAFGPDHSHTLTSVRDLADLTRHCGRFDEANGLWERCVGAKQTSGGVSYDGHLGDAFERAKLDLDREHFDDALQRIEPVLDAWTTEHGPDHLWTALARSVQARALHGLGRHGDALQILRDIRPIFEAEYGAEHEHVGFLCREIARVLPTQGDVSAAREHVEAARRMQESALPAEHYELADTYHLLGQIEEAGGDKESAAAWMEKAHAIRSAHTPEHPKTTRLRDWLTGRDLPPEADPA